MPSARLLGILAAAAVFATAARADVDLVRDGQAKAVVLVSPAVMAADQALKAPSFHEQEGETDRRRLRESVRDLAHYLGRMSGVTVEVLAGDPPAGDTRVPILVGDRAATKFGPPKTTAPYKQGFRVVVGPTGVGLVGESDLATSYAIYEVLDRLGCRWFMPGELGEVIPERKTVSLPEGDTSSAPFTIYRGVWYADDAFKRRNRAGGLLLQAGHALEHYVTKEERAAHPEWVAEIGGKPHPVRLRWSSRPLADKIADKILAKHAEDARPSYSLGPDDGNDWDESKDDTALDAGDFDPTSQKVAVTDRLMVLCNRVAEKVATKDPDVLLGVLAYVDYTRPPVREKVRPNVIPVIAPITYSRHHPMTDDRVPGNPGLRQLVEGWGKKARMTSAYLYGYNLAEPSAPNPMLTKWGTDVPILFANNCRFWQPETLPNFETSMHALYMAGRLAWNPAQKPQDIYDEINARFYGEAGKAMAAYWSHIDGVWVNTPEYSGCGFGHLRRWTPERTATARKLLDAAIAACGSDAERRRVALADHSLRQFELFLKLRRDLADGRWGSLADDAAAWGVRAVELGEMYKDNASFCKVGWTKHTVGGTYFASFYQKTYDDAARVSKEYRLLSPSPLRAFRYQPDPDKAGEAAGWTKPDFDDTGWKTTDVTMETWSSLGHHDYFMSMWYRATVAVPEMSAGKKVFLWLGATDGSAKVFVNGRHVPYTDAKGKTADEANGYCEPFRFDITSVVKPGAANSVAVLCTRTFFNELGTGGLLAPAAVFAER